MLTALRCHALKRRLLGVLLFALLTAQALALTHAIAHAPQAIAAFTASAGTAAAATDRDVVWGHTVGSASCHLVDHLLIGQATGFDPVVLPLSKLDEALPTCLPPAAVARLALRAYEARGPPRV